MRAQKVPTRQRLHRCFLVKIIERNRCNFYLIFAHDILLGRSGISIYCARYLLLNTHGEKINVIWKPIKFDCAHHEFTTWNKGNQRRVKKLLVCTIRFPFNHVDGVSVSLREIERRACLSNYIVALRFSRGERSIRSFCSGVNKYAGVRSSEVST